MGHSQVKCNNTSLPAYTLEMLCDSCGEKKDEFEEEITLVRRVYCPVAKMQPQRCQHTALKQP